jgi:hypothetical protein
LKYYDLLQEEYMSEEDLHVKDSSGNVAFDKEQVITLRGFAELVQAATLIGSALKSIKTILTYALVVLAVSAAFNSDLLSWLQTKIG